MDWPSHMHRIENPSHPDLRTLLDSAIETVRTNLVAYGGKMREDDRIEFNGRILSDDELKKFAYTFYHDWTAPTDPKYFFLVQSPGQLDSTRHFDDEGERLVEAIFSESPYINQVNVNQRYLKDWLLGQNKQFAETFFPILREFGLIEYDDLDSYLEQAFYDDFVLTDLVKYRVTTQELSSSKGGNAELSYDAFLKPELKALDPDLVFCFGSYCWPVLYRNLDLQPVEGGAQAMTSTVTNAHGYIYESNSTYVLPLMHFSRQNQYLRNSYFEYLREGLANY